MDRTATAPVEVRTSVVAGLFLGGSGLSISISVVAIVISVREVGRCECGNRAADKGLNGLRGVRGV